MMVYVGTEDRQRLIPRDAGKRKTWNDASNAVALHQSMLSVR